MEIVNGSTMPIPPTLEIINPKDGSVVHEFRPPYAGSDSFYFGRKELITWFGDFSGSERISRQHIVIEANDWEYGMGEIIIKDAGSKNGTEPNQLSDRELLFEHDREETSEVYNMTSMRLANVVNVGFRLSLSISELTDIGHFGHHEHAPGTDFLQSELSNGIESATDLIHSLGASMTSGYLHVEDELLDIDERMRLIEYTNAYFDGSSDFKHYLTESKLVTLIGQEKFDLLVSNMENDFSEIILRRVEDHGHTINFHTDYSRKTMQIMLSDQDEYEGCELVFVTSNGFEKPRRMPGQATIHDNSILHGVTEMKSGVRHSLFFLRNEVKL